MYKTKASLVLASGSPRRREMLSRLGLAFKIVPSTDDEDENIGGGPEAVAQEWACRKAVVVSERIGPNEDHWFLGVDTIVVVDGEIIGKPASKEQARSFLQKLSGRWHEVISGYCLYHPLSRRRLMNAVRSRVMIKTLTVAEIEAYIGTEEPYDKAGAYAVQGIGAFMVEAIEGSYTNVVGLPLTEVMEDMKRLDIVEVASGV